MFLYRLLVRWAGSRNRDQISGPIRACVRNDFGSILGIKVPSSRPNTTSQPDVDNWACARRKIPEVRERSVVNQRRMLMMRLWWLIDWLIDWRLWLGWYDVTSIYRPTTITEIELLAWVVGYLCRRDNRQTDMKLHKRSTYSATYRDVLHPWASVRSPIQAHSRGTLCLQLQHSLTQKTTENTSLWLKTLA